MRGRRLQLRKSIRAQAFDVNVQLILGARMCWVHRQTNGTSREAVPHRRRQSIARLPGRREVIRRTRLRKLRTLDAGDRADGYQQKMRPSLAIGKQGMALPILFGAKTLNPLAGCRVMPLQPMREALILHDFARNALPKNDSIRADQIRAVSLQIGGIAPPVVVRQRTGEFTGEAA
jgi:hypothetical protein